jgi:ribonucleoside-diphosphate reductase alpha subunit
MHVVKRDGRKEPVSFDKILRRVWSLCTGLEAADFQQRTPHDPPRAAVLVAQKVVQGVHPDVKTRALDDLAAETAAVMAVQHPDYARLAARIAVSNLHKQTAPSIRAVYHALADDVRGFAEEHRKAIDAALDFARDLQAYDFFGYKTLERSYLLRDDDGRVVERPQVMLMRVALGIHCGDLEGALDTYRRLSRGEFTHATPTMFNAGTKNPTLASCFLLPVTDDSIDGIFETLKRCAAISKSAGGIGLSASNVRPQGSRIRSTGGRSTGLLPMLRVYDMTARYVDQGGGKRKGGFAVYLEPWHADMRVFLDMKKNHGDDELRARDLFYALWIPDLFMKRVEAKGTWSFFCPDKCPDLVDLHGPAFEARYEEYEATEGCAVGRVPAQDLWFAILDAQMETGTPYMLYKDACNAKSNQRNLGTIRSSNLCTEVVQFSSADEIAVCNLASVALPTCVATAGIPFFDHAKLADTVRVVTRNLNKVIDRSAYALPQARASNMRHRPIGIGVQGLADVFVMLDLTFDGAGARALNREIFETIYFAALEASCALAARDGPYASFDTSPAAQGKLQFDLWEERDAALRVPLTEARWDWPGLRARVADVGLRNSLLVAPMPTASTAQILGNNECFEPFTSNMYTRRVLAGEFAVTNKHLVKRLEGLGLWTDEMRTAIIAANGSVQGIAAVPDHIKDLFKTAWEMSMRTLIDMSADRAPFIDQSQSLNLWMAAPTHAKLSSMHFYAWGKGLKTGMYYLRTRPAVDAIKVTVPVEAVAKSAPAPACRRDDPECEACSA